MQDNGICVRLVKMDVLFINKAALLIANVIKQQIGIPLSQEELNAEEALKKIIEE